MKFLAFVAVLLSLNYLLPAQRIEKLTLTVQEHDEPPNKKGRRDKLTLILIQDQIGNLVGSHYRREGKKIRLHSGILIPSEIREKVEGWLQVNKRFFSYSDFRDDESALRSQQNDPRFALAFDIPQKIEISTDSFNFCQPYLMRKALSTGGVLIDVSIEGVGLNTMFRFDSSVDRNDAFDLKGFLICYRLLHGALPASFPANDYFSSHKFVETVLQYFKVIECEGFYYQKYETDHPELSPAEIRGSWNLEEYLSEKGTR